MSAPTRSRGAAPVDWPDQNGAGPATAGLVLDAESVAAIAELTAARLFELLQAPRDREGWATASEVAAELGFTPAWVREHGAMLGGQRFGSGSRPPWRFDWRTVRAWNACSGSKPSEAENASAGGASEPAPVSPRRRLPQHRPQPGAILASRPRKAGR